MGCGGLGGGGRGHPLGRVAYLPCADHLSFLQTKVVLYTRERGRQGVMTLVMMHLNIVETCVHHKYEEEKQ